MFKFALVPKANDLPWPNSVRPGILLVQAKDEDDARSLASISFGIHDGGVIVNVFNVGIGSRSRSRDVVYDSMACKVWLDHERVDCYETVSGIDIKNKISTIILYEALSHGIINEGRFNLLCQWQSRVKNQQT